MDIIQDPSKYLRGWLQCETKRSGGEIEYLYVYLMVFYLYLYIKYFEPSRGRLHCETKRLGGERLGPRRPPWTPPTTQTCQYK